METIYKMLSGTKDLPPAPKVLTKVLDALHHEQTTLDELGELIAFEPALTAKLLHYCNSAYFSGSEPVSNVPEAINRVGFQTIFVLVSAVSGSAAFHLPAASGLDAAQLWKHSLTSAFGCKFVAEDLDLDSNLLFTAGLLHDIGRVALGKAKGNEYAKLLAAATAAQSPTLDSERAAYGFTHADVGACLMKTWNLPEPLIQSVRFHHRPAEAGPLSRDAACVCVGNLLSHMFEHPAEKLDLNHAELQKAMELLGINQKNIEFYDGQMQENWEFVNTLVQMR